MKIKITRALVSVSDKTGVAEFCRQLHALGIEILSTGGTAELLAAQHIPAREVADYTGFPEIMAGRVKTLHPKIHGGILARRGVDEAALDEHGILPIDMVAVNLYPFAQTIARPDCTLETAIENIDIGGPSMIRAAAKNHASVAVVVEPSDYTEIIAELQANQGCLDQARRFALATKSFAHCARYDAAIADYLGQAQGEIFPEILNLQFQRLQSLRYGENPHQAAAFYRETRLPAGNIAAAEQLQGKELSYNNIADADAALECVKSFSEPACVIVKHANPCGVAVADDLLSAYRLAYATDPTSAFGGIIAFNRPLDGETAAAITERQFVEVIIAPEFSPAALQACLKKGNIRLLRVGAWPAEPTAELELKKVGGGLLAQQKDHGDVMACDLRIVSQRVPTAQETADLLFAWKVVKFVKSNAIVYAKQGQTLGIGAGQMSRVYSAKIAALKAADEGFDIAGSVMASDAFFPFRDSVDAAAAVGISAIIHPGGSMRDAEVIKAADEHGIAMALTGMRHFRH